MSLAPWTRPLAVHLFGPGYDSYGNGCTDVADCERLEGLEKAHTCKEKFDALTAHAAQMATAGTARQGDFVLMGFCDRRNCSLCGVVIGTDGTPVSTGVFKTVRMEYFGFRMIIPACLVPLDADPVALFAPLMEYNAAVVCLPDECALLRSLSLPAHEGETVVLVRMHDLFGIRSTPYYSLCFVPDAVIDDWECDPHNAVNDGVDSDPEFHSLDGVKWTLGPFRCDD